MILLIVAMIMATVAVATFVLAPRMAVGRVIFDPSPDHPVGFGCSIAWLAIRTRDTAAVLDALRVCDATPCNWNSGIGTVYDDELGDSRVFVSPAVNGWTFVVGSPLPNPAGRAFVDTWTPLLLDLAGRFHEVHYYASYPQIDLFAWARLIDGRIVRAFAIGDDGIIWSKGRTTKEERSLGLKLFELRGVRGRRGDAGGELILHPTEEHVLRLAHRWSLDPTKIETNETRTGCGYICGAPGSWRVRLNRKSA